MCVAASTKTAARNDNKKETDGVLSLPSLKPRSVVVFPFHRTSGKSMLKAWVIVFFVYTSYPVFE
jgi:hypothetical protein